MPAVPTLVVVDSASASASAPVCTNSRNTCDLPDTEKQAEALVKEASIIDCCRTRPNCRATKGSAPVTDLNSGKSRRLLGDLLSEEDDHAYKNGFAPPWGLPTARKGFRPASPAALGGPDSLRGGRAVKLSTYQNLRLPNFSVHALTRVLDEAGLDWRAALASAEIDPEAANRPGGTIPARKELAFQLEFVALTNDRIDLWVKAAQAYTLGSFGIRGLAFVTAPTVEAWVEVATGMDYGPGLMEIASLRTPDGTVTGMEMSYPDAPEELIPFSVYRDFCSVGRNLTWLYGGPFPFTRVEFPLAEASTEVLADLPCDIICGSEALRLWWEPAVSTNNLPFGDAFQHAAWIKADRQILDTLKSTGDWPGTVVKIIRAAPELNRKLANVAATLRVSPRTLRRKLELTGHEFAELRDKTLNDLAADLLSNTNHSVARISRTLGYTDPASFTIAFKRWRGMPPTAFREASRYSNNSTSGATPARPALI